jgi:two-component system response regulator YesN
MSEPTPDRKRKASVATPQTTAPSPADTLDWPAFDHHRNLRKLKEGVARNSTRRLTLAAAARVACLEPKYFSAFFRKRVGISFVAWRTRLRVNKAMELIAKEDFSLTQVANAAGFNNLRTFERAFKKSTGMTPMQFKKRSLASPHA